MFFFFFTLPKSQYLQLLFFLSTFGLWCLSSRTELAQLGIIVNGKSWKTDTVIWNHQAVMISVMKHEKLAKNHRNSPHLEEVHVSTPKSWTFITSAPKSLTNWVKVYQSSATFTCRPDVHSKILSPGQNEKNMWGHQDHCWCQHQEQAYVIQIQIQSLCLERVWNGVLSVFFVFLGQNPGQYSSNPFQTFLVGIFT